MTPVQIMALENDVARAAISLGQLEEGKAYEWVRLTKFQHVRDWEASQLADIAYVLRIREAQASLEIAIATLRRAQ